MERIHSAQRILHPQAAAVAVEDIEKHVIACAQAWMPRPAQELEVEGQPVVPPRTGRIDLIEHVLAVEGDYTYTLGMLLMPDAIPRWELQEDDLLSPMDQALRYRR